MEITVNWLAVIVATLVSFSVGALWYSLLFRKPWLKYTGIDAESTEKGSPLIFTVPLAVSFIVAFAMYHVIYVTYAFFGGSFLSVALQTSLWLWFSFSLTSLGVNYVFQGQPRQLLGIDAGHMLALFMTTGIILGLFGLPA